MRIEAQSKLGYYPTPDTQLPLILTWLGRSDAGPARLLDPCCGKGEALAFLARGLGNVVTYGIELSYSRAAEAEKLLDHVLAAGFENAILTGGSFSFCLLNAPYDGETATGGGERLELRFLLSTTPLLCEGGVLVCILPEPRLDEKVARHLAGWYADLRCFRFTEPDYQAFRQVVIFGRKKAYRQPTQEAVDEIHAWALGKQGAGGDDLTALAIGSGEYAIPPSPAAGPKGQSFRFKHLPVTAEDYLHAAEQAARTLEKSRAWLDLIPQLEAQSITPAITPKQGHIAMLVSAGLLGTTTVSHHGAPLLLKGGTEKYTVRVDDDQAEQEIEYDPDDPEKKKSLFRVRVEERSRPTLWTLDASGSFSFSNDHRPFCAQTGHHR